MNFLHGKIERVDSRLCFVEANPRGTAVRIVLTAELARKAEGHVGRPVIFGIRPEDMDDSLTVTDANPDDSMAVKVEVSEPMGPETLLYLGTGAHSFIARVKPTAHYSPGQNITVTCNVAKAHLFDTATERVLT
jgi:multiple sugar transport system ATP-binding protein